MKDPADTMTQAVVASYSPKSYAAAAKVPGSAAIRG